MNILIVDDNEVNLKLLHAQLEGENYTVLEARDGIEALETLEKKPVDLVISDILMPRMDGYRLCTEIRKSKKFASTPVIVYTATYTSPSDEMLSLDLGADIYLRKPANVADLRRTIAIATNAHQRSATPRRSTDDVAVMKIYNEVLVNKLEEKLNELEETQKGLRASEDKYRRIAETAEEGIWTIDAQERTTYVNPKVAAIFGYTTEEMMVGSLYDFMTKPSARLARAGLKRRRTEKLSDIFDFRFRRKDGSEFWAMVASKPIMDEAGGYAGALAMITDIDYRKKSEQALKSALEKLTATEKHNRSLYKSSQDRLSKTIALRYIDKAISSSSDLKFTLGIVLDQVVNELEADAAEILLYDAENLMLRFFVGKGFRTSVAPGTRVPLGGGFASQAILQRKRIDISDLREETSDSLLRPDLESEGFVDYHVMPLIAKGKVLGTLGVFKRVHFAAGPEWLEFFEALAGQAAIAVDNIDLFDSLQAANDQLVLGYEATIEGWSRALDLRDKETEGHTQRVAALTLKLAKAMGVGEDELVQVLRGSLLHDIGKMGVPDNILLKPGKLTAEEWEIMKQHPTDAYKLLSPIDYLKKAMDIPYCHHEKWDGSGYPRGLKGNEIPFTARLFAVVDVYDALISDRPYRKAWPKEKAIDYIKQQEGTHFDPRAVKAFLGLNKQLEPPLLQNL